MNSIHPPKTQLRNLSFTLLRLRNRHFFLIDLIIFFVTPGQALLLRTDQWPDLSAYAGSLAGYILFTLGLRLATFYVMGLYQRFWRYASSAEIARIVTAMLTATLLIVVCCWAIAAFVPAFNLPRSLPLIDALLALSLVTASRASIRLTENWRSAAHSDRQSIHVAIMGAGHTGELIAREIQNNANLNLKPIAFLDDDLTKQGMRIRNIPVIGGREKLPQLVLDNKLDRVIIAMPTASGREVRKIVDICRRASIKAQTMPGIYELLNGTVSINLLRNVEIEDLLRREPIQTDTVAMHGLIKGKRVLVTGGGGSIGSELCRQILRYKPAQLILLGHGENSIFEITHELQRIQVELHGVEGGDPAHLIIPVIADLRFAERMINVCAEHRPQIIFHAGAHKHVPLMEAYPSEAITNNVLGTWNLLKAAEKVNVERFVMISTDKAVNPTSVMGASKRVAEFLVHQAAKRSGRPYLVVRFGNVLGSRGSVVHTFKKQIALGGPVCVTHPEMVRYFMTIPEAVQLSLQASVIGQGGEVFMLDMGEPVKIVDLARDLIELSGFEVGRDIDIVYTGRRPGEKLFEEMFTAGETYARTTHAKVLMAANASTFVPHNLDESINMLVASAWQNDTKAIRLALKNLLPEYQLPLPAPQGPITQITQPPKQTAVTLDPLLTY